MTFKELRITQRFKLNIGYYTKLDDNNARVYAPGKRKPPIVRVRPEEPVVPVADFSRGDLVMTKGYRVTFTVGQGFDKDGKRLDNVIRNMDLAKRQAAEVFGGFSLNLVDGGWFNDQGEYVGEPSARFEVIVSEDKLFSVDAFAVYLRLAFNQASVLVTREPVSFEFIEAGERTSHIVSYQQ